MSFLGACDLSTEEEKEEKNSNYSNLIFEEEKSFSEKDFQCDNCSRQHADSMKDSQE